MYYEHLACDIDIPFVPTIGMDLFISEKVYDQLRLNIIENKAFGEYLLYLPESYVKDWHKQDVPRDPTKEELDYFIFTRHLYVLGVAYDMESETLNISASTYDTYDSLCKAIEMYYHLN